MCIYVYVNTALYRIFTGEFWDESG